MSSNSQHHHFAHHFESEEHEYATSKEGVWLFLVSEILMFGGLFVGYIIYQHMYPQVFHEGAMHLDWRLGALNTIVLLFSSLTMVLGVHFSQLGDRKKAVTALAITILCGAIFMCVKYIEYSHKIHEGLLPGAWYTGETHGLSNMGLYFSFYFMMTGLHGTHVLGGMCLILWVLLRANKGEFNSHYYTPVEGVGLFWHLVDLIWIFLFPLLYLVG
ncbi:MAG: cytochrome c oxidase subunit 3 family protein [Bdellovibrionaceae bacterium]|nr:cytochrome c oxidase subunit 3 family protein [Pseudobdellovibrionaceae bacterium]